ncbi:MAG: twin-arginine translocase TatA/TatE family subunit [Alphaproteobacteria bacterium]|nr:twin-arginine translocase TatA/TatE family subunit [Alphaproteobacteria bacterium]MBU0859666.1 twin-arginine translocase TatA/TatE family subunit [Alphaproteobacteria bacterium]
MTPGIWQILLIVLVIVLLFGTSRLPRVMEDLAKGLNAFKKGMKDEEKQPLDDKTKDKE